MPKTRASLFQPEQFVQAHSSTPADKAKFANHLARFLQEDFRQSLFTKAFYRQLSNTFFFIAHYNEHGFWSEYFEDTDGKIRFVRQLLTYPCYGSPSFTYSDVEKAVQQWLAGEGLLERLVEQRRAEIERAERARLAQLMEKYHVDPADRLVPQMDESGQFSLV